MPLDWGTEWTSFGLLRVCSIAVLAGLLFASAGAVVAVGAQGGPPPFLTFPILLHVGEPGLDGFTHCQFGVERADSVGVRCSRLPMRPRASRMSGRPIV